MLHSVSSPFYRHIRIGASRSLHIRLLEGVLFLGALSVAMNAFGQGNNNNNNNNAGGIAINAEGVVSLALTNDSDGSLDKKRREAAASRLLSNETNRASRMRVVSLVELEKQVDAKLAAGEPIPNDIFYLGGLLRIDHVFIFPESKDLVIAGPAEGFAPDAVGRMIGVESGRPILRLDDLAIALRTVGKAREIGCSIDPVPERLAALQKFVQQGGPSTPAAVEGRFKQMDDVLGLQNARIDGVPAESHFGIALLEADYRLKRVSIGLENSGVKGMKSHLAMLGPGGNTIQRWWFVPLYDGIFRSDDGLAYQFAGQRVQLLSQEEMSDVSGNRVASATTRLSTQAYAKHFTDKFPELAEKMPIFAELQSLIDWSVFAALLQQEGLAAKAEWKMSTLLDDKRFVTPTFNAPKKIPSSVNYKRVGNLIIGLVGGGVTIHPQEVLRKIGKTPATSTALSPGQKKPRTESVASPTEPTQDLMALRSDTATAKRSNTHPWWWDK